MSRTLTLAAVILAAVGPAFAADQAQLQSASAKLAGSLGSQLKSRLEAALAAGPAPDAIGVCQSIAPEISKQLLEQSGAEVGRTSMRVRNPGNAPDAWEQAVLADFERQKAAGADMSKVERGEFVQVNGKKAYRYMRPIMTAELCTKCHGTSVDPGVQAAIKAAYPSDQATGYSAGDLRGAFTVSWPDADAARIP